MLATLRNGAVLPLEGDISAAAAKDQIQRHVAAHGMPKFLALVGGPQAIPLHCETGTLFFEEKCRDAPYGDWIADGPSTVFDSNPYLILVFGRGLAQGCAESIRKLSLLTCKTHGAVADSRGSLRKLFAHFER